MQLDSKILDDLVKLSTSMMGTANQMRRDFETHLRSQFEKIFASFDVVSREEFEAVRLMAAKAREEQEKLEKRIAALEAKQK